jgi:hypothetical protein
MKTAALLVALLLTLLIAPSPSHANTVEDLLNRCESDQAVENVVCVAYIRGVASMLNLNCQHAAEGYDIPPWIKADLAGLKASASLQGFKNWARDNPKNWSEDELTGVIAAMVNSFPCKN